MPRNLYRARDEQLNRATMRLLSPGMRVLVPDLLGFGGSPDGSPAPHAFEQARALLRDLDALHVDVAHIVGFDFGGEATRWIERVFRSAFSGEVSTAAASSPHGASLPALSIPVTVIWGDRDPFFPVAIAERTARRIPGARLVVLSDCGHFLPNEKPDEVTAQIRDA